MLARAQWAKTHAENGPTKGAKIEIGTSGGVLSPQTLLKQSWFIYVYPLQSDQTSFTRGFVNYF